MYPEVHDLLLTVAAGSEIKRPKVAVCPPEKRRRPARVELSSDTTECEGGELKERSPPRRVRGRHRGKQRGHVTSKRQLGTTFVPR